MDAFFDIPTLIAIGVVVVVLLRLRSVLGTRTGTERPPAEPLQEARAEARAGDNVVPLRKDRAEPEPQDDAEAERRNRKREAEIETLSKGDADLAQGLRAFAAADPDFSPKAFLDGAKTAYEMVVTAFAEADRKTLKMLLEKDVFDSFDAAIAAREAEGHKLDFTLVGLPGVHLSAAEFDGKLAHVSVTFRAETVSATRDGQGNVIDGSPDQVQSIADEWTFARNPKSRDPNWKLVATNQLD